MSPVQLGNIIQDLEPKLLSHLFQSTCFALVAIVVAWLLKTNAAKLRYWIWFAAMLKFLLPFSLLANLGHHFPLRYAAAHRGSPVYDVIEWIAPSITSGTSTPLSGNTQQLPVVDTFSPFLLGGIVWLTGAIAVLFAGLYSWLYISRLLQEAEELTSGREFAILQRTARQIRFPKRLRLVSSASSISPAVYGFFRPTLIWPKSISQRLNDQQLESIFIHELCHVRRYDNLISALGLLISAVCWFHPLVWWLGSRLEQERERACDEAVLAMSEHRSGYADCILKVYEFCLESPTSCMSSVNGGNLKRRIVDILDACPPKNPSLWKIISIGLFASSTVIMPFLWGAVQASDTLHAGAIQLADISSIRLDAVSIKENRSGAEQGYIKVAPNGNRIVVTNTPMFRIIGFAFNKQRNDLIEGLPDWAKDIRWDIEATIAEDSIASFKQLPFEKQKELLQQILKDRCAFSSHSEKKQVPVYALTVSKSGSKLQEVPSTRADANAPGWNLKQSAGRAEGRAVPMDALIYVLSKAGLERQIVDRTGLKGRYDMTLSWTPEERMISSQEKNQTESPSAPSIFTALQEQLGLKLEATKADVDAIVVTHIDRPSEN